MQQNISDLENRYSNVSDPLELINLDKKYFEYLLDAIKIDPQNISILIHLGVLSWEPFHKQEQAIAYLQKAIEYDPINVEARFWLAKCFYHDFCDYKNAQILLEEALKIDPQRADCLSIFTSIIHDTTKDWNKCIIYLQKAIQSSPDWPQLYFCLATEYLKVNRIADAEIQADKIEKLIPLPVTRVRNGVEYYYETIVTGRSNKNIQKDLLELKQEIQNAKLNV